MHYHHLIANIVWNFTIHINKKKVHDLTRKFAIFHYSPKQNLWIFGSNENAQLVYTLHETKGSMKVINSTHLYFCLIERIVLTFDSLITCNYKSIVPRVVFLCFLLYSFILCDWFNFFFEMWHVNACCVYSCIIWSISTSYLLLFSFHWNKCSLQSPGNNQ